MYINSVMKKIMNKRHSNSATT